MSDEQTTTTDVVPESGSRPEAGPESGPAGAGFFSALRPTSVPTAWVLLICGIAGMAASVALTIDRIEILKDPSYRPACSINPIISCGSVMVTEQGAFLGFPNPLLGLPAFAVVIVTAVFSVARFELPRWYWTGQAVVAALGQVFVGYLIVQSLYRIHALCPYCMVVWTLMPVVLILSISRALPDSARGRSIREWLWVALPLYYVIVIAMITLEFWSYWKTLL
ncbi:vitamin K epoxide reductase family protein [Gordonia shandongensis]|uniref:vitamin K epoxide reductase family protein n=1 Tax=Gordonia shandongensis TaxID=376351 RepID=UPI000410B260|nr:vitamin K epoxide reductase family protein [Gordonia shandongensis]